MKAPVFLTIAVTFMITLLAHGEMKGKKAPELKADQWVNLPKGQKAGPLLHKDWKGKIVYLYFFQSWCPGCHSSGFPALQKLEKEFGSDPAYRFAAVQTVFEGFGTNTPEAAKRMVKKYKLQGIPVGHSGSKGNSSPVMRAFQTRGTPWTVIIGKDGTVKYEGFHISVSEGKKLLRQLKEKK